MKLLKSFLTLGVVAVVSACSGASDMASSTVNTVKNTANTVTNSASLAKERLTGTKTIAYTCSVKGKVNQPVVAVYSFKDDEPVTATVSIQKKTVGKDLTVNTSYQDGVQFVSGTNIWSLDVGFNAKTAETTVPVMFTANNEILAKNCAIAK